MEDSSASDRPAKAPTYESIQELICASLAGDVATVNSVLFDYNIDPGAIKGTDSEGMPRSTRNGRPLMELALRAGQMDIAKLLLSKAKKLNTTNGYRRTVLHVAIDLGLSDFAELLIKAGCNVDCSDNNNCTPLHQASKKAMLDTMHCLINAGCNVDALSVWNETPLMIACRKSAVPPVKRLLAAGADVNARDMLGETPLIKAIVHRREAVARLLVANGADVTTSDNEDLSPLQHAINNGLLEVAADILAKGVCNQLQLSQHGVGAAGGVFGLLSAVQRSNRRCVEALLDSGVDINGVGNDGLTAVATAARIRDVNMLRMLLWRGASVEGPRRPGCDPLLPGPCSLSVWDAHPHFTLHPLYIVATEGGGLALMKIILAHHYRYPYQLLNVLLRSIMGGWCMMHQVVSATKLEELTNALYISASTVPSLKSLCRGVIRRQLGVEPAQKLKTLELPSSVRTYLQLDDSETAELFDEAVVVAGCSRRSAAPATAVDADPSVDDQEAAWRLPAPGPSYHMGAARTATADLRLVPRGRRARRMMEEQ